MLAVLVMAAAATTGSPALVLAALTLAVFRATTGWVGAYPTFSELFPGVGTCVAVGRVGAIIGNVVLGLSAAAFGLSSGLPSWPASGPSALWPG